MKYLRIPKERVGVLVGHNGIVKGKLEKKTGAKISIKSDGEVIIDDSSCKDSILAWKLIKVITAIGRGFIPQEAVLLLEENVVLDILDLELAFKSQKSVSRIKARIIGRNGKIKGYLENALNIYISIYGNTVGILGEPETVQIGRESIEMLIKGTMHSTMIKFIEKKQQEYLIW